MALQLTVPERATRLLPNVELNPGKAEKWLASLPLLNVAEGGRKLYTALTTYNRIDIDPDTRLELLELLRVPIQHIVLELQKQYVGLPLPLPDKSKTAAQQHFEFQMELAYGYKHVLLARHGSVQASMDDVALPLERAIYHLTQVLLASYLSYSPCPANCWHEVHRLYAEAERLGVTEFEIDEPLNTVFGKNTVAQAYKHALLLDLGDPYHLPSRMIVKIDQYLDCYAGMATLHRTVERVEPNCQFLIDLESDRAGILYSSDTVLDQSPRYHLLNTVELARRIHFQLKHLQDGLAAPCNSLPDDFYQSGGQEMLRRLINVWGVNPKRTFRRNARSNLKLDVIVGLDAICFWLNGGRRFVPSGDTIGPFLQVTKLNAFEKARGEAEHPAEYDYVAWDIKDDSAGGMSLQKNGSLRRRVKVGDLVAGRVVGSNAWTVSAVRWIKSANPSSVEMGIQRLAPSAIPAMIKVFNDDNQESDFLPALMLPAIPALREPPTLVTPRNVHRSQRVIFLDDGKLLRRLVANDYIETTGGFERFAFTSDIP